FYGNGETISYSLAPIEAFCVEGFNVVCPDYVGYALSGGRVSDHGIYETADAVCDYLMNIRHVSPRRLVIVGRSLGGAAAIYLASTRTVGGLATFSAFTSLAEVASERMPFYPVRLLLRYDLDNLSKMSTVRCPVFLAHGTRDSLIPFE